MIYTPRGWRVGCELSCSRVAASLDLLMEEFNVVGVGAYRGRQKPCRQEGGAVFMEKGISRALEVWVYRC